MVEKTKQLVEELTASETLVAEYREDHWYLNVDHKGQEYTAAWKSEEGDREVAIEQALFMVAKKVVKHESN